MKNFINLIVLSSLVIPCVSYADLSCRFAGQDQLLTKQDDSMYSPYVGQIGSIQARVVSAAGISRNPNSIQYMELKDTVTGVTSRSVFQSTESVTKGTLELTTPTQRVTLLCGM